MIRQSAAPGGAPVAGLVFCADRCRESRFVARGHAQAAGAAAESSPHADVMAVVNAAASALGDETLAVAVVDRAGTILGVYRRPGTDARSPDIAVSLARTTAYFSNDQAPLSSRTVRFISGIHFPPGIADQPNAALYGVENINRGCDLDAAGDAVFNFPIDRAALAGRHVRHRGGRGAAALPPVRYAGLRRGRPHPRRKRPADLLPRASPPARPTCATATTAPKSSINGGGVVLFRGSKVIGGVGVAGSVLRPGRVRRPDGGGGQRPRHHYRHQPSGTPARPRAPSSSMACACPSSRRPPTGAPRAPSPAPSPRARCWCRPRPGRQAPEGYLIGPRGSTVAGGLTVEEVRRIVEQAVARAQVTRAQVRLPYGQFAAFIIAVTDQTGQILAEFRMPDALFDAVDVVPSKARNAYYFSTREGYEVLRSFVDAAPYDDYRWEPEPPAGQGWALTSRTLSFGGQPLFPPGTRSSSARPLPGPGSTSSSTTP